MKMENIIIVFTVAFGIALESSDSFGADTICDYFEDKNPYDGDPVAWEGLPDNACPISLVPVESGGFFARNAGGADGLLLSQRVFNGDIRVLIRANFNNIDVLYDAKIKISLHTRGNARDYYAAYYASISRLGIAGMIMWPGPTPQATLLDKKNIGAIPINEDLDIEFMRCGDNLEFRVWPSAGERPLEPHLSAVDAILHSGKAAFGCWTQGGNSVILRSICITTSCEETPEETLFSRGDANADDTVNIADAVFILSYLFDGDEAPICMDAADANDDESIDISDAVAALSYLFGDLESLPEPFESCGPDPETADKSEELTCKSYLPCEDN